MEMVLIYLAPFLNPFSLMRLATEWGNTAKRCEKCCPHSVFNHAAGSRGVSNTQRPPHPCQWWMVPLWVNRNRAHECCCVHAIKCGFRRTSRTLTSEPSTFSFWCGWSLSFWQMFRLGIALGLSGPACWSLVSFSISPSPPSHLRFVGKNQAHV